MAIRTGKDTSTMSEGLYQVVSAFGDSSETAGILEVNARAAAAGLAAVKEAVDLTSAVMKGYGDVSQEAANKTADLAFQTVKLGQTTFAELAASIGRVTPLAAQLKVSQEELFTGFATLTGVTGSAAEVSTQMAGAMRALLKPTDMMKKALKHLGYESGKAMLGDKGLIGTFKTLFDLTGGNEQVMTEMFGRMEPLVAIFALLGPQAQTYADKLKAMKNATGAMNEAFKEQTEGINKAGFTWDQFKIRVAILAQTLGDVLAPAFMKILNFLSPIVTWFKNLNSSIQIIIVAMAGLIAVLAPVLILIGFISSGLAAIAAVAGTTAAAVGLIVAQVIAVGAAIAGVLAIAPKLLSFLGGGETISAEGGGFINTIKPVNGESNEKGGFGIIKPVTNESNTQVEITVTAANGASAVIDGTKSKGPVKPNIIMNSPVYQGAF